MGNPHRLPIVLLAVALGAGAYGGCGAADFGEDAGPEARGDSSPPDGSDEVGDLCFDGLDNDGDGLTDCDDPSCEENPVCCLGETSELCCDSEAASVTLWLASGCGDGAFSECEGTREGTPFGDADPIVEDGGLVPNGQAVDSGLVFDERVDPRVDRLALEATFLESAAPCDGCPDGVGVGLITERPTGASATLRPDVGLLVSGVRGEASLFVAGEVVERFDLGGDGSWTLALTPDGTVTVSHGGAIIATVRDLVFDAPMWPIIWGRSANRVDGEDTSRLASLTIATRRCPIPWAFDRRSDPLLPDGVRFADGLRGPSASTIVSSTGGAATVRLVYEADGTLHAASIGTNDRAGSLTSDLPGPASVPRPAQARHSDPDLHREGSTWVLYYAETVGDISRIHRTASASETLEFPAGDVTLDPGVVDALAVDGPSVLFREDGRVWLAVRARDEEGTRIVLLESFDTGQTFSPLSVAPLRPGASGADGFDRDEVAGPALVEEDGHVRLYYAGRRGNRWSIGLAATLEGQRFRALSRPMLGPSGQGFDAVGVRDPALYSIPSGRRLLFSGTDGAHDRLGFADESL